MILLEIGKINGMSFRLKDKVTPEAENCKRRFLIMSLRKILEMKMK